MKKHTLLFLLLELLVNVLTGYAQQNLSISGKIVDTKGAPLKSATVFLSGTERITAADEEGRYMFNNITPGTHQLSVTMVGFTPFTQNVIVKDKAQYIEVSLKVKPIELAEVNIGGNSNWDANFKLFRQVFLGTSANAKACVILNPSVINFTTKNGILLADADEFLVIENKRLGYKIRYMIKNFGYNKAAEIALYEGETSFEQLPGTDKMKKQWAANRLETYKGSVMHFLRSVYQNRVREEGFLVNELFNKFFAQATNRSIAMIAIDLRTVNFSTMVSVIDSSLVSFKPKPLYVVYNPARSKVQPIKSAYVVRKVMDFDGSESSAIKPFFDEAIIDSRGSHADYRDFFIEGKLAQKRVGDQLPFEYSPN